MARPKTGQTPPISFRPPAPVRDDFDARTQVAKRDRSDALIEAMHDWIKKQDRAGRVYITTDASDRYHATAACPRFQAGRHTGDERHPILGLTTETAAAARQTPCPECVKTEKS
ncbi:hypothetical protein OG896_24395 [Streptomyces sp. NBC_00669]|uniref:hypothetical protein n=1 Tax=Streptomyces sp. NBC_00669 TaxID=2976011 RepID=UPI002E2F9F8F|nr:hypothetical protein [Streptomyces sp. NBC_00669]